MKQNNSISRVKRSICLSILCIGIYTTQAQNILQEKKTLEKDKFYLPIDYHVKKIYPKGTGTSFFIFDDKLFSKTDISATNFSEVPSSSQYTIPVFVKQQPVPFLKKQPTKKTKH